MAHRTAERKQFLGDIITGSVEAGWPWFMVEQYQWTEYGQAAMYGGHPRVVVGERIGDDTHAVLRELDEDEENYKDERLTLDLDAAARGLKALITYYEEAWAKRLAEDKTQHTRLPYTISMLKQANRDNDAGDIDADIADTIVQMALLGEIRYG